MLRAIPMPLEHTERPLDGARPARLRIAMVLDAWEARTGAVISTRRFVELLRAIGHEVTVITTGAPEPGKVVMPEFYPPLAAGVMRRMRVPLAWSNDARLAAAVERQDVVHVHFPFWLGSRAITRAREAGVPVVSSFHVQAEHLLYNVGVRSGVAIEWVYRRFLKHIYQRSDCVVCPSAFAEAELRRRGLRTRTEVISNGVTPLYRPLPPEGLPQFPGKRVHLSVGRLAREKHHEQLIEAVRRSRHEARIQLVLIGDGPLREQLEARGRALSNPPIVLYLHPDELVRYYNAAELYVHAAEVEVECMAVLEAMACGLPCLIARSPKSATSQFALSDAWLYRWDSTEALTARLDDLLDAPPMLRAARPLVRMAAERYRIERSVAKLLDVYGELVDPRATPERVRPSRWASRGARATALPAGP